MKVPIFTSLDFIFKCWLSGWDEKVYLSKEYQQIWAADNELIKQDDTKPKRRRSNIHVSGYKYIDNLAPKQFFTVQNRVSTETKRESHVFLLGYFRGFIVVLGHVGYRYWWHDCVESVITRIVRSVEMAAHTQLSVHMVSSIHDTSRRNARSTGICEKRWVIRLHGVWSLVGMIWKRRWPCRYGGYWYHRACAGVVKTCSDTCISNWWRLGISLTWIILKIYTLCPRICRRIIILLFTLKPSSFPWVSSTIILALWRTMIQRYVVSFKMFLWWWHALWLYKPLNPRKTTLFGPLDWFAFGEVSNSKILEVAYNITNQNRYRDL